MTRLHLARACLVVAGTATAAMGAFHFLLPHLFGWERFTTTLPAEIRWALFALNAFLSLLLLCGGLASLVVVRRAGARGSVWPMAVFWAFNTGYQALWPFPASPVRWVLLGFALAVTLLYLVAVCAGGTVAPQQLTSPGRVSPPRRRG